MIEFNKCYFVDCLDPGVGLPHLVDLINDGEMDPIHLGYTDYPWGVNVGKTLQKGRKYHGRNLSVKKYKEYFEDPLDLKWNLEWFGYFEKICKQIVLIIPDQIELKQWWFNNTNPSGEIIINMPNGHSSTKVASHHHFSTYLLYGKFKKKLTTDVINYTLPWGFLSKEKQILHPTPKGTDIPLRILLELQPETLIDPFAGSFSFPYAAHLLGIKWIAYEKKKIYDHDYKYRFSQKTLGKYIFSEKTRGKFSYAIKRVRKVQAKRKAKKEFEKQQRKEFPQLNLKNFMEVSEN